MKSFATADKRSAPAAHRQHHYVHHPMGPGQQARRAEIRRILGSAGAQAKLTIGQPDDNYERAEDRAPGALPSLESTLDSSKNGGQPSTSTQRTFYADLDRPTISRAKVNHRSVQRKVQVDPGVDLDTMGYTTTKTGDTYSCPTIVKASIWNEIFTALLNSPRVFKLKGSTAKTANESFRAHMAARRGIVSFASKKKYAFNVTEKRNATYWQRGGPTGWELKPAPSGTSLEEWRKKAHADINVNPDDYEMACNQATRVTMEGGAGAPFKTNTASSDSDWIPGDAGYITNTAFVSGVSPPGTEGENIIYTGKDKFWGHLEKANTYRTLQEWFDVVEAWDGGARKETHRLYPSNGIE
ncbi:MAG: hypothetical protein OES32_08135 [Acidobacteriota bacterium]|nr:hypothetical protein [Acidobacteriota bacterium]